MFYKLCAVASLIAGLTMAGCAKKAENVAAAYVSPLQYETYDCRQISEEAQRISQRVAELTGVQNKKRSGDVIATTAAIVVFWPAAFLVSGDDAQTAELARLKGEFEAVKQASIRKNCSLQFEVYEPPPRRKSNFKPFAN